MLRRLLTGKRLAKLKSKLKPNVRRIAQVVRSAQLTQLNPIVESTIELIRVPFYLS